jgi:hypothetical protein
LPKPTDGLEEALAALAKAGAITLYQAEQLPKFRGLPEDDLWAHPYFRTIKEHTRAYLQGVCS